LQGFFLGLIPLIGLFLWKNLISLLPPRDPIQENLAAEAAQRDTLSGMTNLLVNHLPRHRLLEACLQEWEKAFRHQTPTPTAKLTAARRLLQTPSPSSNPPVLSEQYHAISNLLSQRK
jgi:hypothetical protein